MDIFYLSNKPKVDKRIVETRNSGEKILDYDADNAYPQRMRGYAMQSGNLMKCLKARWRHIIGEGFKDKLFYKAIINKKGQTVDQLMRVSVQKDYVHFDSFAWVIRYNAAYEKVEVRHVNFDYCRLGELDDYGDSTKIAVYDDWDKKMYKRTHRKSIVYWDKYNPNPAVIEAQVAAAGGWDKWKGQLLYFSLYPDEYPLASYDPIINEVITDFEISNYDFQEVTTGFSPKLAYKHPTKFETPKKRQEKIEELQQFEGPSGGKIIMLENVPPGESLFEEINQAETANRYDQTASRIDNKIRSFYNIPPIIVGEEMNVGLGNSEIIKNAFDLYNSTTADDRLRLEEIFKDVFSNFKGNINQTQDFSVLPLTWKTNQSQIQTA